jgi:hypothetical protein
MIRRNPRCFGGVLSFTYGLPVIFSGKVFRQSGLIAVRCEKNEKIAGRDLTGRKGFRIISSLADNRM